MSFLNTINIIGSGLTAQQLRLDVVSENVTNSQTTRVENGEGAYRRKMVVFELSAAGTPSGPLWRAPPQARSPTRAPPPTPAACG